MDKPSMVEVLPNVKTDTLAECVTACFVCAQATVACADACLGEDSVKDLRRCIRLNLDCSDVALSAGRVLSRQQHPDSYLIREQLELLLEACRACGDECEAHQQMEHCRVCMDACRDCELSAQRVLSELGTDEIEVEDIDLEEEEAPH
ncbi:MAG: four-helix bundle copper-binding protein [Myxococcaceae bacterium]